MKCDLCNGDADSKKYRSHKANEDRFRYQMIDLFAGIGGIRLGFEQTGAVDVVFSSEIDKYARKTYHANFKEEPSGDVTKIDARDIPDHDILVGGFPCQAFSCAGLQKGFNDTRGTLFFEIARILKEKRPMAFMLENVKNLVSHDNGNTFKTIINTLKDIGYSVCYEVLAAKDFGVPQLRRRIYIVGFNRDNVPNWSSFRFPMPPRTPTRLGDILESNVDPKCTISSSAWDGFKHRKEKNKAAGKGFGYSVFNEDSPFTNTISARYGKDGSEILIEQLGDRPRKLTPREAARLQGFTDSFVIPVSDTQAYKQFGNSVAVPVVNAVASQLISVLDSSRRENES